MRKVNRCIYAICQCFVYKTWPTISTALLLVYICAHVLKCLGILPTFLKNPCEGKELCLAPILLESHITMVVCTL